MPGNSIVHSNEEHYYLQPRQTPTTPKSKLFVPRVSEFVVSTCKRRHKSRTSELPCPIMHLSQSMERVNTLDGCIGHDYAYQSVIYLTINLIIDPKDFYFLFLTPASKINYSKYYD